MGPGGATLHRTAGGWTVVSSPVTQTLRGVRGTSPSNVWAVGDAGTMIRFDGTQWSIVSSPSTSGLTSVWAGGSASQAWASGVAGGMFYWNGLTWSKTPTPTNDDLAGVWGTSPTNVWAIGAVGTILHYAP